MAHGGDAARPPAVEPAEPVSGLRMAGAAQGLVEVRFGAGAFDSHLGAAAVRRGVHLHATCGSSGEFALQVRPDGRGEVRVRVLLGDPRAVHVNLGEFASQARLPGAGCGDPVLAHGNPGMFRHQIVGLVPNGLGAVNGGSRELTQQPHPVAGRGDIGLLYGDAGTFAGRNGELHVLLPDGVGAAYDNNSGNLARQPGPAAGAFRSDLGLLYGDAGTFALQLRPIAGRDAELNVLLSDGVGAAYDNNSSNLARQPGPAAGAHYYDGLGTLAEHLRRFLPVVAMVASSAAVTGLAAGRASPAAGFGFFALLLGGLSLVMIHVLRA